MRLVICGIYINKEKKILLVKKGETFILPGGQCEKGETDEACLLRELAQEELPHIKTLIVKKKFGEFDGMTPFSHEPVHARVYWIGIVNDFRPEAEISASGFFTHFDCVQKVKVSEITRKVADLLKERGYLR